MLVVRRSQQQRRGIDRAARHDEDRRLDAHASRPFRSTSTASTLSPAAFVISRRAYALVHSSTFGCSSAGRTQHTSASLFACTLHANELQVLQRMQPSRMPSGSGDGCSPCCAQLLDDRRHALGVRNRRDTGTRCAVGFGRVDAELAVDVIQPFGPIVVRRERVVVDRPCRARRPPCARAA